MHVFHGKLGMASSPWLAIASIIILSGMPFQPVVCELNTPTRESLDDIVSKIDTFVEEAMSCHTPPALTLSVVKDGQVIMSRGYGHTAADKETNATSKTKFAIGSLTKAFTALLVAKLASESDNITLDTPITKFVKGFQMVDDYRSNHATFRDLLGHRMAIPDYEDIFILGHGENLSRKDFTKKLHLLKSPFSFREKFIYNNFMYLVAADILEQMSNGASWEELVRNSIFNPLNMSDSGFVDELKDNETADFALPCDVVDGTLTDLSMDVLRAYHLSGPAGTIHSTADDMAKWMNFLLSTGDNSNPKLPGIGPETVQELFQPGMIAWRFYDFSKPSSPVSHVNTEYAMAFMTGLYREYRQLFHSGGIATHTSMLALYPDLNIGIFMAVNGPVDMGGNIMDAVMYKVADLMIGLSPWFNDSDVCSPPWSYSEPDIDITDAPSPTNPSSVLCTNQTVGSLEKFAGKYVHVIFGDVYIGLNSSTCRLTFSYGELGHMELVPNAEFSFHGHLIGPLSYLNSYFQRGVPVEFVPDDENPDSVVSMSFVFQYGENGPFYKI